MITLLAIVIVYLLGIIPTRNSELPPEEPIGLLSELDDAFVRRYSPFRKLISQKPANEKYKAFQHFVLALSDQQIVTGLAIFIIAYSRHCTMFTYHFFLIVAMVWFSSTTHLSTLVVLKDYLDGSPGLKYSRLIGMLTTFIMLFVGLLVLYTNYDLRVRVQCRLYDLSIASSSNTPMLAYLCMILVLIYLTLLYLTKSLGFCFERQSPFSSLQGILFYLLRRDRNLPVTRKEYYAQKLGGIPMTGSSMTLRTLKEYWLTFNFAYSELLDSFLWEILLLFFNNLYGIRQILWARFYVKKQITVEGNENEWGFGQVLALLLLALPVLAAAEARRGTSKS